jgi:hypothetical protein
MKERKFLLFWLLSATVALFVANGVFAQSVPSNYSCTVTYGSKAGDYFTIRPIDDEFQKPVSCIDDEGIERKGCVYNYEVVAGTFKASRWYQTGPCFAGEGVNLLPCGTFSSITEHDCGEGLPANESKTDCFADNVEETKLYHYTSAYPGEPNKIGIWVDNCGLDWSSFRWIIGNGAYDCVGGAPGPGIGEIPFIKNTVEYQLIGDTLVRFEINYKDCTYRAFDPVSGAEYQQFPLSSIIISGPGGGGASGVARAANTHGKCEKFTLSYGSGTCSVHNMGGWVISIPPGCTP